MPKPTKEGYFQFRDTIVDVVREEPKSPLIFFHFGNEVESLVDETEDDDWLGEINLKPW